MRHIKSIYFAKSCDKVFAGSKYKTTRQAPMELQLQTQTSRYPVRSHVSGSLASYVNSHESSFFFFFFCRAFSLRATLRKCRAERCRKIQFERRTLRFISRSLDARAPEIKSSRSTVASLRVESTTRIG